MNARVSVVLPTFNRLKYLRAAVESVLAQTLRDWELVIADDGSDGETLDYLRQLAKLPRVQVLHLRHSGNLSAVRNVALRAASGDYIAFLDSDDVWMPAKLERQMASLLSKPGRRWSYTGFTIVDGSLNPLDRPIRFSGAEGWIVESVLDMRTAVVTPTVVVRRDLLEETGLYDEQLPICGDFELWVRLAARSAVDCVREPLVLVRRHTEHSCDDLTACRDFSRALDKIRPLAVSESAQAILRRQCAIAAGTLARSQASSGLRLGALATLLRSAKYSWAYREWWRLGVGATARIVTPKGVRGALRRGLKGSYSQ